ncbi:MAG TPA: sugar kinase, partial [Brevundimonas sp.]|nr:sugar kinase [Brevundimonas sp.]
SATSAMRRDEIDWDHLFGSEGVRWLHTGGIFSALSESTAETALAAVTAARRHGTIVSYDLNYRASLWAAHPDPEAARRVNRAIAEQVDVLIGDEYSLAACLGIETPEVRTDACDPAPFAAAAERLRGQLPNLRLLASPLRDPVSASMNRWGACAWADGALTVHAPVEVAILDRVGGGDGFVSGLAFGLMEGRPLEASLALGVAHGALAMTTPGDNAMTILDEVEALARGDGAAARR